jgi:hypothetical protein
MRALLVSVTAAAALLAAGCSSDTPDQTDTTQSTPTRVAAKIAPVSAFTEVVAEYTPQLQAAAAEAETTCQAAEAAKGCQDAYHRFGNIASQLHGGLLAVHGVGLDTYQGAPPAGMASLLSDTETLASRASRMADTYHAAVCADVVLDCTKEKTYAQLSAAELVQKLAAWDAHM